MFEQVRLLVGFSFASRGSRVRFPPVRLKPHPIYLMGRTTTYALGPAAGNHWGATRAAHRITTDITGVEFISNGT